MELLGLSREGYIAEDIFFMEEVAAREKQAVIEIACFYTGEHSSINDDSMREGDCSVFLTEMDDVPRY